MKPSLLVTLATQSAVLVAGILVAFKFYAWIYTQSLSLQASLIDSILDFGLSVVNFLVVRQALKPADADHRFGHGKVEAIYGLAQATFIAGSAIWLFFEALQRLHTPVVLQSTILGTAVMIGASALTFALVQFQSYVVKTTNSLAIEADSAHYKTDLFTNVAVLLSLNVTVFLNAAWFDVVVGVGIAVYILHTSYEIALKSIHILMDRELDEEIRDHITAIALSHPHVLGIHELRTRSYGQYEVFQFHLDMPKDLPLWEAHAISDAVEAEIHTHFPKAEIIVHQDPV